MTPRADDPDATRLVEALLSVVRPGDVRVILLFGSRLVRASPDRHSAYDLVVVCERYRPFYEALARVGAARRSPALQSALNRLLAPNVIAFAPDGWDDGPVAKIMVIEPNAFERALGGRSPDHFLKGRMVQRVAVLHARDDAAERWVASLLSEVRADVPRWAGPFVEQPFTAERLAHRMLEISYGGEVRPEAADRVQDVFEAQRELLVTALSAALERAADERRLVRIEGPDPLYRFPGRPGTLDRFRVRLYFLRSKARATARWLKHVVTFDNWLDYIAHKVQRRTGMRMEITPWERRLPYLLLWPKVFRVLRHRPVALGPGREGGKP
jgi:hypothetical protein